MWFCPRESSPTPSSLLLANKEARQVYLSKWSPLLPSIPTRLLEEFPPQVLLSDSYEKDFPTVFFNPKIDTIYIPFRHPLWDAVRAWKDISKLFLNFIAASCVSWQSRSLSQTGSGSTRDGFTRNSKWLSGTVQTSSVLHSLATFLKMRVGENIFSQGRSVLALRNPAPSLRLGV